MEKRKTLQLGDSFEHFRFTQVHSHVKMLGVFAIDRAEIPFNLDAAQLEAQTVVKQFWQAGEIEIHSTLGPFTTSS